MQVTRTAVKCKFFTVGAPMVCALTEVITHDGECGVRFEDSRCHA